MTGRDSKLSRSSMCRHFCSAHVHSTSTVSDLTGVCLEEVVTGGDSVEVYTPSVYLNRTIVIVIAITCSCLPARHDRSHLKLSVTS